jgi:hypothetical protein
MHDASSVFTTFVVSLAFTARIHLGDQPDPDGGEVRVNRPMARQVIDQLEMLQEKTEGNLTEGEEELLQDLLTDLRLRYAGKD